MGLRKKSKEHLPGPELNTVITPMLDLAFQVLLFFILTYHPSQVEEGQMDLNLPDSLEAQAATPAEAQPKDAMTGDLDLPSEITVFVRTQQAEDSAGKVTQITVQDKVGKKDVPNPNELYVYLKKIREGLSNQRDIKIQADSRLKYGYVMEVMDRCTQAGFTNVSFGPPPDQPGG